MDCRFVRRVKELIAQVERERQEELAEAETLLNLETLAVQIGDMVSRELTQLEVARRADAQTKLLPLLTPVCESNPSWRKGLRCFSFA